MGSRRSWPMHVCVHESSGRLRRVTRNVFLFHMSRDPGKWFRIELLIRHKKDLKAPDPWWDKDNGCKIKYGKDTTSQGKGIIVVAYNQSPRNAHA